ncbi:MAG: disulfide isomerase DsbC N-terminal domain-containing protein [Gammaproteobacteria bacterium]|nr:disulfide isomerase DsbC N-terminal domain-containing protein [Gammaproteobacteria bacterium]
MKIFKGLLSLAALLVLALPALADGEEDAQARAEMAADLRGLSLPVTEVRNAELEGFYEVLLDGMQSIFVTRDGRHFFTGDLYRMGAGTGLVNLSEQARQTRRKEMINAVDASDMVVFSPPEENIKATVNVFTDIDCGYCRKLHQEVPELNRLGIVVRYLGYPRAGLQSRSYDKLRVRLVRGRFRGSADPGQGGQRDRTTRLREPDRRPVQARQGNRRHWYAVPGIRGWHHGARLYAG